MVIGNNQIFNKAKLQLRLEKGTLSSMSYFLFKQWSSSLILIFLSWFMYTFPLTITYEIYDIITILVLFTSHLLSFPIPMKPDFLIHLSHSCMAFCGGEFS